MNSFFEGKDFRGRFKALMPEYYPPKYKQYIRQETELLKREVKGTNNVLEAGVGIGRIIPVVAPLVHKLVGIDNAAFMLREAQKVAQKFPTVTIKSGNLEELSSYFPKKYFDISLCLWNTLGNVRDEVKVLQELKSVSKRIFITVYKKGTLSSRIQWYKAVGIPLRRIDRRQETFYTQSGLRSKSYHQKDISSLAKKAGLKVKEVRVLAGVVLWVELYSE